MPQTITVKGIGDVDFPDEMSRPEIEAAISKRINAGKSPGIAQRYSRQSPGVPPSRADIDAVRMRFFNTDNPDANDLTKAATALSKSPNDKTWASRVRLMHPASQAAIKERAEELRKDADTSEFSGVYDDYTGGAFRVDRSGVPIPTPQGHDIIQSLMHGPEGARQLQTKKGFAPEIERAATSLLDPDSLALMGIGGGIAANGKLAARAVTGTFAGLAGKGAYDKFRSGDLGGALADIFMGSAILGGHAVAEKKFFEPMAKSEAKAAEAEAEIPKPEPETKAEAPKSPEAEARQKRADQKKAGDERRAQREADAKAKAEAPSEPETPKEKTKQKSKSKTQEAKDAKEQARQKSNAEYDQRWEDAKTDPDSHEQAWGRYPGEPMPPPSTGSEADWTAYQKAHTEWAVDQQLGGATSPPPYKEASESYTTWKERREWWTNRQKSASERDAEDARWAAADERSRKASEESRQRYNRQQEWSYTRPKQSAPPPTPEPEVPFEAKDPGTPHPEVDKFNAHAEKVSPRVKNADEILKIKQRIAELNNKPKKTSAEKVEFGRLNIDLDTHMRGLQEFADRYKAATGKDSGVKVGTWSDNVKPTGREQMLDIGRQAFRNGDTKFENMFPDAEPTPEAETSNASGSRKAGGTGRNRPGMVDLSTRGAPGSPAELFHKWLEEHPEDIAGAVRAAAGTAAVNVSRETPVASTSKHPVIYRQAHPSEFLSGNYRIPGAYWTDNPDLALGQGKNKGGITFAFQPADNADIYDPKEKTILDGKEYKIGRANPTAGGRMPGKLLSVTIPKGTKLPSDMKMNLLTFGEENSKNKLYDKEVLPNGDTKYTLIDKQKPITNAKIAETPKPNRFSIFNEEEPQKAIEAPAEDDEELNLPEPTEAPRSSNFKFPKGSHGGFINLDLPPPVGAGAVGRVLHHGPVVTDAFNKYDASKVSGQSRAALITRDLHDGLDNTQIGKLGEWLRGNQLNYNSKNASTQEKQDNAANNPLFRSDTELNQIASDPKIKAAIDKWEDFHRPALDKISTSAGVTTLSGNPHYFPLLSQKHIDDAHAAFTAGGGTGANWEARNRPRSTGRRNEAKNVETDYSADVGAVLRTVLRKDETTARLNDLVRTLHTEGLLVTQPRGKAGAGWQYPNGYAKMELQGMYTSAPKDIKKIIGRRAVVYMPKDIVQTMQEIGAAKPSSGDPVVELARKLSSGLTTTMMTLNPVFVPFHIYRQTAMLNSATRWADAKRDPLTMLPNFVPVLGALAKGGVIGYRNVDDPVYRDMIQEMIENNVISPRSMEGLTKNLVRIPVLERASIIMHDSMFGMPEGRGVKGWAIRLALEAKIVRQRYEGSVSPEVDAERDRKFIQDFGAYTQRNSAVLGWFAKLNPFTRTHVPRVLTSLKHAIGDSGLKTPHIAGESDATYRARDAGNRLGYFALMAGSGIIGFYALNKALSGKWPHENGKGNELKVNLGQGHFISLSRLSPEFGPVLDVTGMTSRMNREKSMKRGVSSSGKLGGMNTKVKMSRPTSPVWSSLEDMAIGTGNTALSAIDSPALSASLGLLNRRAYITYDNAAKSPDLMKLSPAKADPVQRVKNYISSAAGLSNTIPLQGDSNAPEWSIGKGIMDYVLQGMVKTDRPGKGVKPKKLGRM